MLLLLSRRLCFHPFIGWLVGWFVSGITQKLLNISTKPGLRMDLGITVGTAVANTGLATWLPLAAWLLFKASNLIERMLVLNSY